MKKKEAWMKVGAIVMAYGKQGTIIKLQENQIDGIDYVYYIDVKLSGQKHSSPYHPNDVSEVKAEVSND